MKRIIFTWLSIVISFLWYMPVQAAEVYSDGYFYYHKQEGYNSICGYFGKELTVTVPSFIAGRPVSRIEAGTFEGCSTVEKLVLPDTIMEIEEGAFSGAKNLVEIEDASGVWKQQEDREKNTNKQEDREGNISKGSNIKIEDYEYEEADDVESAVKAVESDERDEKNVQTTEVDEKKHDNRDTTVSTVVVILIVGVAGIVIWRNNHLLP